MAGFGESLRREREMRRISLEEISETTKISVRFLDALENEDFTKLPGGIFVRSFVRAYANYLGLDSESVMAEYHLAAPATDEEDLSKLCLSSASPKQKKRPPFLPWVFAVALLGSGYGIFRYTHRSSEAPLTFGRPIAENAQAGASKTAGGMKRVPPQVDPGALAPTPGAESATRNQVQSMQSVRAGRDAADGNLAARVSSTLAGHSGNPAAVQSSDTPGKSTVHGLLADPSQDGGSPAPDKSSLATAERHGELVLQVAANQPSWIAVDADGKTVLEHVLGPDNVRTLIARNYFDVTTGNAQGTVLTLNGVTLKPLGRHGEVRRIHLTHNDIKAFEQ